MKQWKQASKAILSGAALLIVLAVGSPAPAADTRFIPIDVGGTLTFHVKDNLGQVWYENMGVSGMVVIPPTKIYYIVDTLAKGQYKTNAVRSTSTALYQYKGMGLECMAWKNGSPGDSWTYTEAEGNVITATIEAIEDVTVPAGTFTGCLRIKSECKACPGAPYWYEWVKPGFMMVKMVDYWIDNAPVTKRLYSYEK